MYGMPMCDITMALSTLLYSTMGGHPRYRAQHVNISGSYSESGSLASSMMTTAERMLAATIVNTKATVIGTYNENPPWPDALLSKKSNDNRIEATIAGAISAS